MRETMVALTDEQISNLRADIRQAVQTHDYQMAPVGGLEPRVLAGFDALVTELRAARERIAAREAGNVVCDYCNGTGEMEFVHLNSRSLEPLDQPETRPCPKCGGRGVIFQQEHTD